MGSNLETGCRIAAKKIHGWSSGCVLAWRWLAAASGAGGELLMQLVQAPIDWQLVLPLTI